jgi:hypothetical protein
VEGLTPEQERAISRMAIFLDTLTEELGRVEANDDAVKRASATGAAKRVAKAVLEREKT